MSDGDALLAAILAQPGDDAARLVYADWLQEHGQEAWAELIRVQVEMARPAPERPASMKIDLFSSAEHVESIEQWKVVTARRPDLEHRERELLAAARDLIPLPEGWRVGEGLGLKLRGGRGEAFLRRGFVERVVCSARIWVTDAEALLLKHPVERVQLTTRPAFGAYRSRSQLDGPGESLYSLGDNSNKCIPANEDPFAVWTHSEPDDSQTGRIALLLLAKRWPGIRFELPQ